MTAPVPILLMGYDLRFGGSERQLTEVARHLDRSRFIPHVACIHMQGGRRAELERHGVPLAEFSFPSFGSWRALRAASNFATYLRRHAIQLVHSFDVPANIFAVPVAAACRIPVVLSSQRAYRELTPGMYHRLLRMTDSMVTATVVNSDNLRHHLMQTDRIASSRLLLCYNSVDLQRFAPGPGAAASVLPGLSPVIGSTAVMRPEKGVGTLLEAFAMVAPKFPKAGLLLVGGGPLENQLEERAAQLGLADRVHFAGPATDVLPWLRRMDIFVLPSLSEALSNSLLEAMATGCAAIASDVGGNPELLHPDSTGYLFRPGDAGDLAQRMELLSGDTGLRQRLSQAARLFVSRTFSREASLSTLSDVYGKFLQDKGVLRN